MEIINNKFISSNSNTENENVNTEFGLFEIQKYRYISAFPENITENRVRKYKIIKDKSVFDE